MEGVSESERERRSFGYWGKKDELGLDIIVGVGYEKIRKGVIKG